MTIISEPSVTVNKLKATVPASLDDQKILFVGQALSSGSFVSGDLNESLAKSELFGLFGDGSMMQNMLSAAFDVLEDSGSLTRPQIDAIALADNGSAVQAEGTITVAEVGGSTNAATVAGTIKFSVGSQYNYSFDIDVTVGQGIISGTGNISDAIVTAINALVGCPVSATQTGGVITLTAKNGGTVGNKIGLKVKGLGLNGSDYVLGNVSIALTAFSGGATDPSLTDIMDVVGDNRYQTIVFPYEYGSSTFVANFLDSRFNVDDDILDGIAISTVTDTLADLKTNKPTENSQSYVLFPNAELSDDLHKGGALLELDYVISSRIAVLRALRKTEGSNITRITPAAARGALDAIGGMHINSLPYPNTPMYHVSVSPTGKGFTKTEIAELEALGYSSFGNNKAGNAVILGTVRTTYLTDTSGNPDTSWRFAETVDTMSAIAEYFFNNLKQDFAQTRLTQGNIKAGYAMVNDQAYRGQLKLYYTALADIALVPDSSEAISFFMENLTTIIDTINGKITASGDMPIVVQLRELIVNLRTNFGQTLV